MLMIKNLSVDKRGFTLIELITVLVFAGIILAIAVPNFKAMIKNNRLATSANDFVATLNLARSEAISRGARVTVCRSDDMATCNNSASHYWEDGWIIFQDSENTGTVGAVDLGDELIRVYGPLGSGLTMRSGTTVNKYVSFLGQGQSRGNGGLGNDTFRLCDSRGKDSAYSIIIIATGRVITQKTTLSCP